MRSMVEDGLEVGGGSKLGGVGARSGRGRPPRGRASGRRHVEEMGGCLWTGEMSDGRICLRSLAMLLLAHTCSGACGLR